MFVMRTSLDAGRDPSQFSHGLTGRYGTMAYVPDIGQDADLRIWILRHRPDARHWSTDQTVALATAEGGWARIGTQ
jgi:hypothetical protein